MFGRCQAKNFRSYQRTAEQIEWLADIRSYHALRRLEAKLWCQVGQIHNRQGNCEFRKDRNPGFAVYFRERCAEIFMSTYDFVYCAAHGRKVQDSLEKKCLGQIEVVSVSAE